MMSTPTEIGDCQAGCRCPQCLSDTLCNLRAAIIEGIARGATLEDLQKRMLFALTKSYGSDTCREYLLDNVKDNRADERR